MTARFSNKLLEKWRKGQFSNNLLEYLKFLGDIIV